MTYEGFRLKVLSYERKLLAEHYKKQLVNKEFTIISNNCWGGMVYESFNLPKQSPTVGMFMMANDYIKFCSNLRVNLNKQIVFIQPEKSRYVKTLKVDKRFGTYPIGVIDDIEIMFLHYHSEQEATDKWNRRCERICWDKMIVKFNDQNRCKQSDVEAFSRLPFEHKLFFTVHNWPIPKFEGYYRIKQYTKESSITASHEPYVKNEYFNFIEIINQL